MAQANERGVFNRPVPTERIYSRRAIRIATFIAGPFVGAYLLSINSKVFRKPEKAKKAWLMCSLVFIVIYSYGWVMRGEKNSQNFPPLLIPFLYAGLISLIVRDYQGEEIERHMNAGGATYGFWNVLAVSISGLMLTVILMGTLARVLKTLG